MSAMSSLGGTLGYYESTPGGAKTLLYPGWLTQGQGTAAQLAQAYDEGRFQPTPGYNPANYPGPAPAPAAAAPAAAPVAAPAQSSTSTSTSTATQQTPEEQKAYQDYLDRMTGPYREVYDMSKQAVANYGAGQQTQLANTYAQQKALATQNLQGSGLGNTTIGSSVQTGIDQAQTLAQQNLAEQIGQYQVNTVASAGQALGAAQLGLTQQQTGIQASLQQQAIQNASSQSLQAQQNQANAAQQQAAIQAQAAAQQRELQAQQAAQAAQIAAQSAASQNQFNYATALASQQYGYNANLQGQAGQIQSQQQKQQSDLQNQYQRQLLQLQQMQGQQMSQGGMVAGGPHGVFG